LAKSQRTNEQDECEKGEVFHVLMFGENGAKVQTQKFILEEALVTAVTAKMLCEQASSRQWRS